MKKRITLAVWSLLLLAGSAAAQTVYDGAKFIDKDLNGTARFVSMGGAMSALGGDISTMNTGQNLNTGLPTIYFLLIYCGDIKE